MNANRSNTNRQCIKHGNRIRLVREHIGRHNRGFL
jgi:hypothetical protein